MVILEYAELLGKEINKIQPRMTHNKKIQSKNNSKCKKIKKEMNLLKEK